MDSHYIFKMKVGEKMNNILKAILKTMFPWLIRIVNRVKYLGKNKDKKEDKGEKC